MDGRHVMGASAVDVSWPDPASPAETRYSNALQIGEDAISANVDFVERLLTELFQNPGRRADEQFQNQLDALQNLLLGLKSLALTDDLTSICNRRGFMHAGGKLLETLRRDHHQALVFYFDVDNLKAVNDAQGHVAGDALLVRTAQILRVVFRKRDLVGRLGGDEFAALAPSNDPRARDVITRRLEQAIADSNAACRSCDLSFSIGCTQFDPGSSKLLPELLKRADITMYGNKLRRLLTINPDMERESAA